MPNLLTRPLNTGGPYGHVPGAEPPFHAAQNDPGEDAQMSVSRLSGQDETLNPEGWVGYSSAPGGEGAAYAGRDLADQATWNGRPYNEAPGMFGRLREEAAAGG